jgi:hypothetical protein
MIEQHLTSFVRSFVDDTAAAASFVQHIAVI